MSIIAVSSTLFICCRHFSKTYPVVNFSLPQNGSAGALPQYRQGDGMGAAVVAVVFVLGLLGVPTLFGHASHAKAEQVASVHTPPAVSEKSGGDANAKADAAASDTVANPVADTTTDAATDASRP
ncbi:MAG: hypothetical protein V4793_41420 [Paraburkholderia tropica]|nr:hypothetical protein [Paraburkholderia tropica]MBB3004904.1 hypothetical protein [Paraburkholderia tropica]MBB6323953.1 hypothetical protein [Paraburkholderia tropica]MDE1139705.1 hypothetical protein [Paraburkholderia tropica]